MNDLKTAATLALNVLKTCRSNLFLKDYVEHIDQTIKALEEALKQEQGEPVLEVVNGKINRSWDAIPDGFTGLLYMHQQLTIPPKKPQEPWHGSARVDDYNRGWNECIDSIYTKPQPSQKPLTTLERVEIIQKFMPHKNAWNADGILIDMVEAAHGIKE